MSDDIIRENVTVTVGGGREKTVGMVIAKRVGDEISLGYALLNPSDTSFDPQIGETIAWRRLLSGRYRIGANPSSRQIKEFIEGTGRVGRRGKFHPIRHSLVGPMTRAIERASRSRASVKLPA